MNQAYSRLSTTHGHITDCKLDSVVYVGNMVYRTGFCIRPCKLSISAGVIRFENQIAEG